MKCIMPINIFFQCEKSLFGHKGAINSLAIHPSGKLALSVGNDKTLHTWDLMKGRKAYVTNLKEGNNPNLKMYNLPLRCDSFASSTDECYLFFITIK